MCSCAESIQPPQKSSVGIKNTTSKRKHLTITQGATGLVNNKQNTYFHVFHVLIVATYMVLSTMTRNNKVQVSRKKSGRKFIFGSSTRTARCT